jgi:hypothetical protein
MTTTRSKAALVAASFALVLSELPVDAAAYRISVRHLDANLYQAVASKVIIETRVCGDLGAGDEPQDAVLNWEGAFGANWLMFTSSKIKCDVVTIR